MYSERGAANESAGAQLVWCKQGVWANADRGVCRMCTDDWLKPLNALTGSHCISKSLSLQQLWVNRQMTSPTPLSAPQMAAIKAKHTHTRILSLLSSICVCVALDSGDFFSLFYITWRIRFCIYVLAVYVFVRFVSIRVIRNRYARHALGQNCMVWVCQYLGAIHTFNFYTRITVGPH
jgi:hypothetical protein